MKTSIRFYDDREVRAIWDDSASKWWFSVLDIVAAINRESDYAKTRNYWKYLKAKLKKDGSQLVSATTQLKLRAPDGKLRLTDCLDSDGVVALAKAIPNSRATDASELKALLNGALTTKINDREIFMKGIDYSYYYEEGE